MFKGVKGVGLGLAAAGLGALGVVGPMAAKGEVVEDPLAGLELPERPVRVERLDNGLVVAIEQDPSQPRVAVAVGYAMGSADDPEGYRGLCHLTEHLMFQGSRHVSEDRFFRELELAGMTDSNGTTESDDTVYHEVLPASRLETALWLESDRLAYLLDHLNPRTLDIQKRVVQSEWRLRGGDSSTKHLERAIVEALHPPGHPYRLDGDDPDDVGAVRLEHAQWFFQRWYTPTNATLAIVGDVDPEAALALAKRYFGPIRPSAAAVPADRDPMAGVSRERPGRANVWARASLLYDRVEYYWRTPAWQAPGDAALDLAASVLRSRLWKAFDDAEIRPRRVSVQQQSRERGSHFHVLVRGNLVQPLDRFVEVTEHVLAEMLAKPEPQPGELRKARRRWLRGHFDASEGLTARARFLAKNARRRSLEGNRLAHELRRYRAVTAQDVAAAVREHLDAEHRFRIVMRNDDDAERGGQIDRWEGARWDG